MISPVESAPPVLPQGSEPDVLLRLVPSGVSVVSAPSLGGPDEGPAGRLVQGAGEARGLDEGPVAKREAFFWDRDLSGLGVRVHPTESKVYMVHTRARGKSRRVTIGRHGVWTPERARREAGRLIASLKAGETPRRPGADSPSAPAIRFAPSAVGPSSAPRRPDSATYVSERHSGRQMTLKGQWSCLLAHYSHIETVHYPLPTLLPRGFDRAPLANCALCPWWVLVSSLCSRTVAYGWAPKGGRVHGR